MNIPTKHHVIRHGKEPVAVVVPYRDYVRAFDKEKPVVPHEVVGLSIGRSMIRAWREYLGLTQTEVAARMGISQPAYQKLEDSKRRHRMATLKKVAAALGLDVRQIDC